MTHPHIHLLIHPPTHLSTRWPAHPIPETLTTFKKFDQSDEETDMKANFPKAYFPKAYFPKAYFPKGYFPKVYFQKNILKQFWRGDVVSTKEFKG